MLTILRFVRADDGATAIEYGLIAAAIGGVLIASLPLLRNSLRTRFNGLATGINNFS